MHRGHGLCTSLAAALQLNAVTATPTSCVNKPLKDPFGSYLKMLSTDLQEHADCHFNCLPPAHSIFTMGEQHRQTRQHTYFQSFHFFSEKNKIPVLIKKRKLNLFEQIPY
ncbi:hypothetical protein AB205_0201410 [Aquarana catesbeiana]|uniref:Secreted protein n=1 Tax=Aquarana catesbeiana TaxID=8400 RepID=A0A2G9QM95_AQUCT|nr:hypothetical protein AB205_0201410 [Aquarana catesbeiana]